MAKVVSNAKYKQIESMLKSQILNGTYTVGDRIPSQNELMRDHNVSYATVIRALQELVREGYLIRIHGKGTFVADRTNVRKGGAASSSRLLGISLSSIDIRWGTFGTQTVSALESAAREHDYRVIVTCSDDDPEIERANLEDLYDRGVDGLALWYVGGEANVDWLQRFKREGVPLVLFDRYMPSFPTDYVVTDNRQGALEAVRCLIEMGHSRIACLACNELVSSVNERINGYRDALGEAGLAEDSSLTQVADWHHIYKASLRLARSLLQRETGPLAIFAVNGTILRAVWQAVCECGRSQDSSLALSVVDDPGIQLPDAIPFVVARQPQQEMGRKVIEILTKKVAGDQSTFEIVLPPTLSVSFNGKTTVNGEEVNRHELVFSD